jgi:type II secretory pathway component PulF
MSTYNYAVRDKAGKVVKGKLDGDNKAAVQAKLAQMGYIILELDQQGSPPR